LENNRFATSDVGIEEVRVSIHRPRFFGKEYRNGFGGELFFRLEIGMRYSPVKPSVDVC